MNAELLHRREQLLQRMTKGMTLKDVAEQMTKDVADPYEREKQVNVIRRDWSNRSRWMTNVVRLSDGTFLTELVAGMNEAMKCCWVEYYRAKNPSAKIGALRTVIMGKTRVGLLLMKAGVIEQATQHIESTMTIAGTPFDVDPELRKALLAESEKQREERESAKPGASGSGQE
jgi:hypothetical protein